VGAKCGNAERTPHPYAVLIAIVVRRPSAPAIRIKLEVEGEKRCVISKPKAMSKLHAKVTKRK
jgi:hypothetical protein